MDTQNENLDPKVRLSLAQWTLDKNLGWIAASEVKSAFIFAAAASMLGVLYSGINSLQWLWPCLLYLGAASLVLLGVSIICTISVVIPRLKSPNDSLFFFGSISQKTNDGYRDEFLNGANEDFLEDIVSQIHRNSQIAVKKQKLVKTGIIFLLLGLIPWALSVLLIMFIKWHS